MRRSLLATPRPPLEILKLHISVQTESFLQVPERYVNIMEAGMFSIMEAGMLVLWKHIAGWGREIRTFVIFFQVHPLKTFTPDFAMTCSNDYCTQCLLIVKSFEHRALFRTSDNPSAKEGGSAGKGVVFHKASGHSSDRVVLGRDQELCSRGMGSSQSKACILSMRLNYTAFAYGLPHLFLFNLTCT